jgi:hypothetical protein
MAIVFSDNFNRPDSTNLGANWTELNGDSSIAGNQLTLPSFSSGNPISVRTTTTAHAALANCKVTITQVEAGSADGGPVARLIGANKMYAVDTYTGRCEIYRHDLSPTGTLLGSGANITQVAGSVISIETSGQGPSVSVKSYYQGSLIESINDNSSNRILNAGQTGVYNWAPAGSSDYDNFSVDNLAPVGPSTAVIFCYTSA